MTYKYYECEDGASQYDDLDLKRQNMVEARYIPALLDSDRGDPFIEALPMPRQGDAVDQAYTRIMSGYNHDRIKDMSGLAKMLQVGLLRTDVRFTLPFHRYLEFNIYNAILISYRSRRQVPLEDDSISYIYGDAENRIDSILVGDAEDSTNAGCSLTGFSGCGKSSSISITVSQYPQVIRHENEDGFFVQIPIIVVTCEAHSNFQALYYEIGKAIDRALGHYRYSVYAKEIARTKGLGSKAEKVMEYIEDFSIGMIIFDEIQLIDFKHEQENSFNSLLTIANRTKVAMVFVGTEDARAKMYSELRIARRAGTDINGNSYCTSRAYFGCLVDQLFEYQWFDELVEPDDEIKDTLYDLTHGIVDQLVGLYSCMNYEYLYRDKKPKINSKFIRWVSKEYYAGIQNVLNNLDDPKSDMTIGKIKNNADILINARIDEIRQKEEAERLMNNNEADSKNRIMLKNVISNVQSCFNYTDKQIEDAYSKIMKRKSSDDKTEQEISGMVVQQLQKEDQAKPKRNSKKPQIPEIDTNDLQGFVMNEGGNENEDDSDCR